MTTPVEKPKHLNNPRRAFVKRNGKKLVRKIAAFQSRQSTVPDTPKISNEHFQFLNAFTENWEVIQAEAREVLKFRDAIPTFHEVSPDQYRLSTENNWKTFVLFGFGQRLEKTRLWLPKPRKYWRVFLTFRQPCSQSLRQDTIFRRIRASRRGFCGPILG